MIQVALRPLMGSAARKPDQCAGLAQEAIDSGQIRLNRPSGKMGYAVAEAAVKRGASVVLVSGPTALDALPGVERVSVVTAEEMRKALLSRFDWCDTAIMAAAAADAPAVRLRKAQAAAHAGTPSWNRPRTSCRSWPVDESARPRPGFAAKETKISLPIRGKSCMLNVST
ncbi:MAG: phosphopantothenoylcysteine decarboxylase [Nitrospiraceae bacterium]